MQPHGVGRGICRGKFYYNIHCFYFQCIGVSYLFFCVNYRDMSTESRVVTRNMGKSQDDVKKGPAGDKGASGDKNVHLRRPLHRIRPQWMSYMSV